MKLTLEEKIKTSQNSLYFERALFVVGPPSAGKSYQIRYMFRDVRLNNGGNRLIGTPRKKYSLSNERKLHVRITSPHEYPDDWDMFIKKLLKATLSGRWNFVSAMQTNPPHEQTDSSIKMPNLIDSIDKFLKTFNPERVRLCFLSPMYMGNRLPEEIFDVTIPNLLGLDNRVECCTLDANFNHGLFLADFFDFT